MTQIKFRPGIIAASIAIIVTLAVGLFADHQNSAVYREQARADVTESLGALRAKLESNITQNIQLMHGLVALIATEPSINQAKFERVTSALFGDHSQLIAIAAAPDLVVNMIYPLAGNEAVLGLDYTHHQTHRDMALETMRSRSMTLAGPIDLVQGGRGFIGRFPVFVDLGLENEQAWGLVSAVIDVDQFYKESGLLNSDLSIQVVLMGQDANLSDNSVFFGDANLLNLDPVMAEVSLPTGGWHIAAIPLGGWKESPPNAVQFRTFAIFAAFLVILPIAVAGYFYDQHSAHVLELGLRQKEMWILSHRLNLALETSQIGVWELNIDTGELRWDARMKDLYGVPSNSTPNAVEHWQEKLHPEDRDKAIAEFENAILSGSTYESVFRVMQLNGTTRWIRAIGASHMDSAGHRLVLGVNWDISEDVQLKTRLLEAKKSAEIRNIKLEEARIQMKRNSNHDSLTGLPNRRFLDEQILDEAAATPPYALIHIDLDRFKHINDTLGHAAGDAMLVHAADVLRENTRKGEFVARIGGDEFIIALTEPTSKAALSALADRIINQMRQPVPYKNHKCRFGASIGIAANEDGNSVSAKQLLIDADLALYRAKKGGRNRFEFFDASLKAEILSNKALADEILTGLERREFLPYFQPQFDANTLKIIGVEALVRWEHPAKGVLAPGSFLHVAEELNVVPQIDSLILEETLRQSERWEAAGIRIPKKSVNVSDGQLRDPDLINRLAGLPIKPGELSFELLESIFLDEKNEVVTRNIEQLKRLGIDIEIDDFGTGYASIISLLQIKPARLKIERRLIAPIANSGSQRQLIASIIEIGKSLDIQVLAEGVETAEHVAILRDLGCDALQGFVFAKPMTSNDLIKFVHSDQWHKAA